MNWHKYAVLVTGGNGSFGHTFVNMTLNKYNPKRIIIYSRDDMKQWEMSLKYEDEACLSFWRLLSTTKFGSSTTGIYNCLLRSN